MKKKFFIYDNGSCCFSVWFDLETQVLTGWGIQKALDEIFLPLTSAKLQKEEDFQYAFACVNGSIFFMAKIFCMNFYEVLSNLDNSDFDQEVAFEEDLEKTSTFEDFQKWLLEKSGKS